MGSGPKPWEVEGEAEGSSEEAPRLGGQRSPCGVRYKPQASRTLCPLSPSYLPLPLSLEPGTL